MKALITGADSLVGSNLVRHLLDSGFTVRALLDPRCDIPTLDGLPIKRIPGDVLDPESITGSLAGVQAVFNCAPVTEHWPPRFKAAHAINVDGTRNLLVGMSRSGVESLVHVGSASSFGPGTMDEPGTEESPFDPRAFRTSCFDSIHQAQELALRYNESGKVRCIIVNPTLVMGKHGLPSGPGTDVMAYSAGGRYTSGGANVVGAMDAARGVQKALGRGKAGRCYILGGSNVEYRELFGKMADSMGLPPPARSSGDRIVIARGLAGSLYGRLTGSVPARSAGVARLAVAPMYYNPRRAIEELELPVSPLDTVVEDACRWLADNR
ncbi:MAG: NAD-dependent epimerase/dehydratase family protein [Actinobacteria bacterium]|nr:NAD-dependent epimerase/dehydratase family protein [Actinomycetota bacterium]MBU4241413.1 NAD-dependent epimerase/dehydratase family protein [Actinomycetota bacterium]MBU4301241.1 NAD-dependent epimerase/dehydratase family protein [Actinomycetota bacterium]MBU4489279.1 NAD-dependent epimerase/dehydratase family protein [Actinomycetota bacterium]